MLFFIGEQRLINGVHSEMRIKSKPKDKVEDWTVKIAKVERPQRNIRPIRVDVLSDNVKITKSRLQPFGTVIKTFKVNLNMVTTATAEVDKHICNIRALILNTNATPIRCVSGGMYCCCFCKSQFPDAAELKRHSLDHDVKVKQNFTGSNKNKTLYDLLIKLDITALKCDICNASLDNVEESLKHLKTHSIVVYMDIKSRIVPFKFDSEVLRCAICWEMFSRFKALQGHMNSHFKYFVCEICSVGFPLYKHLKVHREIHKTGKFKCELCHKVFDTSRKRDYHNKIVHLKVQHHKCGYCGEKFRNSRSRDKHMQEEHGYKFKKVKCKACDRSFPHQTAMSVHLRRHHLMERDHVCSECEMGFFTKGELEKHSVKHSGLKEYLCEYCHKAFGRKNTLREHLRIHEEDRRFKCDLCGQTFVQKCSWKSHMRSRHGETV